MVPVKICLSGLAAGTWISRSTQLAFVRRYWGVFTLLWVIFFLLLPSALSCFVVIDNTSVDSPAKQFPFAHSTVSPLPRPDVDIQEHGAPAALIPRPYAGIRISPRSPICRISDDSNSPSSANISVQPPSFHRRNRVS